MVVVSLRNDVDTKPSVSPNCKVLCASDDPYGGAEEMPQRAIEEELVNCETFSLAIRNAGNRICKNG